MSAGNHSTEDKMVATTAAEISGIIGERSHDRQAEPTDPPFYLRLVEIRQNPEQRIERPAVIAEIDHQPPTIEGKGDLDPAKCSLAVIAVVDCIGEQLLEDDHEPSPLRARQSVTSGEPPGKPH